MCVFVKQDVQPLGHARIGENTPVGRVETQYFTCSQHGRQVKSLHNDTLPSMLCGMDQRLRCLSIRAAILYPGNNAVRRNTTHENNRFSGLFRAFAAKGYSLSPPVFVAPREMVSLSLAVQECR